MDIDLIRKMKDEGYLGPRYLESGELAGLRPMLVTWGLFVGLTEDYYRCRYCYESLDDALRALALWDGRGDPPGPWVKHKGRDNNGLPVDRINPNLKVGS